MIRLVLADDQALFAESLKNILEMRTRDLRVAGIACDGAEAIELVEKTHPDIVLMDVRMPRLDGVEACKAILECHPEVRIMMLTTFDDDAYVHEALGHGAVGYLLKTTRPAELITAIRAINAGTVQISPEVARKLVRAAETGRHEEAPRNPEPETPPGIPEWARLLSHREKELLKHLVQGLNNRQIGEKMFVAEQTVKNHLSVIYSKMGVSNRGQAIRRILEAGLNLTSY